MVDAINDAIIDAINDAINDGKYHDINANICPLPPASIAMWRMLNLKTCNSKRLILKLLHFKLYRRVDPKQ